MTVADNYDVEKQETNGTTKTFTFTFYTYSKDYVKVIIETDGVQSVVPTTDYTIKLNSVGGNVIFTRAPAAGSYIIIVRETPQEQETSFSTSSGFPAKTVEGRFDKLTSMIQETQDEMNRGLKFPVGTDLNLQLPLPEAGKALMWNEDEDAIVNSQTTFDEIVSDAISAKNDAISAKEGAETAQGLAEQARDDAQAAQGYAENAQTAAEYAQTQAENAVNGFDDHVESKKLEVNQLVGEAEGYAIAAGHSADDARDYKDAAAGSASDASGYKTDAQTAAGNANTYAANAQTWAEGADEDVQALGGTHSAKEWTNINASSLSDYTKTADLAAVALSNDYDDLSNQPTIGDATLTIQKNGTDVGTFKANATVDKSINITVPTQASDVGALPSSTKYGASISLSINNTTYVVTAQLKDQDGNNLGSAQTIDLPLESVVVNGTYDDDTKKIILTLQNGNTIEFSVADLVAGLQSEITADNMLDADLVDDSTSTNKFVTASDKTTWNSKQDAISDLNAIRSGASAGATALQPNASITGATKCKITYDSKGLVTDGADLQESDIPFLSKKQDILTPYDGGRYVDIIEKVALPSGYSRLDYLTNSADSSPYTRLDLGVKPQEGDVIETVFKVNKYNMSNYFIQARETSSSAICGLAGASSGVSGSSDPPGS